MAVGIGRVTAGTMGGGGVTAETMGRRWSDGRKDGRG